MVLIKIYPKDTEMYLWSQTSAEGAEDFYASTTYKIQGMWHSYLEPGRVTTQEPQPCSAEPRGGCCPAIAPPHGGCLHRLRRRPQVLETKLRK